MLKLERKRIGMPFLSSIIGDVSRNHTHRKQGLSTQIKYR